MKSRPSNRIRYEKTALKSESILIWKTGLQIGIEIFVYKLTSALLLILGWSGGIGKSPLESWYFLEGKVYIRVRFNRNVSYNVPAPEGTLYRAWFLPYFAPSSIRIKAYMHKISGVTKWWVWKWLCIILWHTFDNEKILASVLSCVTDYDKFQVYL